VRFFYLLAVFLTFAAPGLAQKIIKDEAPASKESSVVQAPESDKNREKSEDYKLRRGDKELQLEFGISPFNPSNFAGPKEFDVYGRHLYMGTLRFGRIVGTKRNVSYEYLLGVTPLAVFEKNEVVNTDYVSPTETPNIEPTKRETTYGMAFQPINFKFIFLAKNRLKPFAQVGAGIMITNKAVPVPRSTLFQLTGDFGGGLMYMMSENRAVNFGYKYFHISNGNIGGKINNPGFNANVFYVNYSFFWNRKKR
jgi:opacity protein-like surface antigen